MAAGKTAQQNVNESTIYIEEGIEISLELAHARILSGDQSIAVPYLVSAPGAGKTQMFKQACAQRGAGYLSYTLGLKPLESMSGLPHIKDNDDPRVKWLAPELIDEINDMGDKHETVFVLLDDFHLCTSQQQAYGFELFTHHKLHDYDIRKNVAFCVAGNNSGMAGAKQTLSAIMNRMYSIPVRPNRKAWLENYAAPRGLNSIVQAYLRNAKNDPWFAEPEACTPHGTPRSWEALAHAIEVIGSKKQLSKNLNLFTILAESCLSKTAARDFSLFYTMYSKVPVFDIFEKGQPFRIAAESDKYPFMIAVTDYIVSKIIDFADTTHFNTKKHQAEFKKMIGYLKIYSDILTTMKRGMDSELAELSTHNLIHNKFSITIGEKTINMLEIVSFFVSSGYIPAGIISEIATDRSAKTEHIQNLIKDFGKK